MVQIKLNLTVVQKRKLLNGHTVQLANSQIGRGADIMVDEKTYKRLMRASRAGKGARLTASTEMALSIEGAGFKSVMKKIGKTTKKVFNEDIKPVVKKEAIKFLHETVRPGIDKKIKDARIKAEERLEDVLIEKLGGNSDPEIKALIQDGITASSALVSRKNAETLDRLEAKVDETLQGMGLSKGQHYAIHGGMVVLQGRGIKSKIKNFFKKVGKTLEPMVKPIIKELATQGVATLGTMATGNPMLGQMGAQALSGLTDKGIDAGLDKLTGSGMTRLLKHMKQVNGGALYVPMGRGISIPIVGKLSQNDQRYYL